MRSGLPERGKGDRSCRRERRTALGRCQRLTMEVQGNLVCMQSYLGCRDRHCSCTDEKRHAEPRVACLFYCGLPDSASRSSLCADQACDLAVAIGD